ncbi:MAG: DUF86 domain-containing protein [Magnetococcales bacterium]|nr:DUF86 domain-containing protein [Magnetococcales bacterium]
MRSEVLYLHDMIAAAQAVVRYVSLTTLDQFCQDELVQSAVLHQLTVIGEAAARMPVSLRRKHEAVPWSDMTGMRNVLVHAYFSVDLGTVWKTAVDEIPALIPQLQRILDELERPNHSDIQERLES